MAFGQIVRSRRNDKGFGLNEFAERLGVSPAYWSRVEREEENLASATISLSASPPSLK
jgi:transcriptional regulator with XRE-family HTH domain